MEDPRFVDRDPDLDLDPDPDLDPDLDFDLDLDLGSRRLSVSCGSMPIAKGTCQLPAAPWLLAGAVMFLSLVGAWIRN